MPAAILAVVMLALAPACARGDAPEEAREEPRVRFTDVTEFSGIRFLHHHGGTGRHYYVETMSGGGAFLDFDGDGWLDVVLVQSAPLPGFAADAPLTSKLFRNIGNGTFTDVTPGSGLDVVRYGMGAAVGDYDNDGRPDLYFTSLGGNRLFHNEGGGKFRDVTAASATTGKDMSTSAAWLDYDEDGWLDLFVARYMDYDLESDPRCTDAQGRSSYCAPHVYEGTHSLLYRNNGDGTFTDASRSSGIDTVLGRSLGVATSDFNADGWVDIFVSNDLTPNFLFLNNGNGTFRETALLAGVSHGENGVAYAGMGTDAGDYKNDGHMGLTVTNFFNEPVSIFTNVGDATFTNDSYASGVGNPSRPLLKWGVQFIDVDLDGFLDLFVVNGHVDDRQDTRGTQFGHAQPAQLFRNNGNGRFTDITADAGSVFTRKQVARAAAFGDVDNDGDVDALIVANNQPAMLWRNDTERAGHNWIRVTLIGRGDNRDGLGARVRVRTDATTQTRYQRSGTSYLSDHDRRMLFGIGTAGQAIVDVTWPCGAEQRVTVAGNSAVVIEEAMCLRGERRAR